MGAIEESAKNRPVHIPAAASEITDEAELLEFMRMRNYCTLLRIWNMQMGILSAKLYEYVEKALAIWEEYETLTEEQQIQYLRK